eukprot:CAMPEP_0198540936 /NCGR_PEP_ID=MMETSP1462-20131121/53480_1 /TAXON_ID=1333877 /ORGANISM="Brandtodinium nutriculum, Strain RCC3387" /LENGTH=339 /DNA_ID=CAMNT_0044271079 /DNA_START=60 /DNA_END=1079 /DNA_ORIENTATION=-
MGGGHSVELFPDKDSETKPGHKCVMSASLDALKPPVPPDDLIDEMVEWFERPVDVTGEAMLKSVTLTENGGMDDFTVKVIFDGSKLQAYGMGKGDGSDTDRVRRWKRVIVDRAKRSLILIDYVPEAKFGVWVGEEEEKELFRVTMTILEKPHRLEFLCQAQDQFMAGEFITNALYGLTDNIVGRVQALSKSVVKAVMGEVDGKVAVVVKGLEEHVDESQFFEKFVGLLRSRLESIPGANLEDVDDNTFTVEAERPRADGSMVPGKHIVKHDADSGEISHAVEDDGVIVNTSFWKLHGSPLMLEAWHVTKTGERIATKSLARNLQTHVNDAIEKANSWFG